MTGVAVVALREQAMQDGFLIVACDGVWDELSNEQAVQIVGKVNTLSARMHARTPDTLRVLRGPC